MSFKCLPTSSGNRRSIAAVRGDEMRGVTSFEPRRVRVSSVVSLEVPLPAHLFPPETL